MLHVRYGKAVRGQQPRRRNVPSVMGWAVDAVADYVENIRPKFGSPDHPALWVTERGGGVKPARSTPGSWPAAMRWDCRRPDAAQLAALVGDSPDRRRGGPAVHPGGGRAPLDTSTAIYTHVSGDFMNTALRKALAPALDRQPG